MTWRVCWLVAGALMILGCSDECDEVALQAALDDASLGAVVRMPGSCRIEGSLVVPGGVTLAGGEGSVIASDSPVGIPLELGANAGVQTLQIEAGGRAALVARGGSQIRDVGVDLQHGVGVYLVDGISTLERVTITGPVTADNAQDARWIDVLAEPTNPVTGCSVTVCECSPGDIDEERGLVCSQTGGRFVTWAPTIGIYARDATVTLNDVNVRGIARYGVVSDGATVSWTGGGVADVVGVGLLFRGGSSDLTNVVVERVVSGLRGLPSYSVIATDVHTQVTSGLVLRDGERFGLLSLMSRGAHEDLRVDGHGDAAVWIAEADEFSVTGESIVEDNALAGVVVVDSTDVTLDGLRVAGTAMVRRSIGTFGVQEIGDGIQLSGTNEAITLRDLVLEDNERTGLLVDVVPGLTFERVEVMSSGAAFGALGGMRDEARGEITVTMPSGWDTGIVRSGAALANDPAASGAFDALVDARPEGAMELTAVVGPMY